MAVADEGYRNRLWVADGHLSLRSLPPFLALWALVVVLTFTSSGSRIHTVLIHYLSNSLDMSADEPVHAWTEDGAILSAEHEGAGNRMVPFPSRGPAV